MNLIARLASIILLKIVYVLSIPPLKGGHQMSSKKIKYTSNRGYLALMLLLWLVATSFCIVSSRLHAESLPGKATTHSCCPHDESSKTSSLPLPSDCERTICSQSLLKIDDHKLFNVVADPQPIANFIITLSLIDDGGNVALQPAFDEPEPYYLLTRTIQSSPNAPPPYSVTQFI